MRHTEKKNRQVPLDFNYSFWAHSDDWPHDPPGHVFLARAFCEIGVAIYGNAWVEPPHINEPEEPDDPPDHCDEATWDIHEQEYDRYEVACEKARVECETMWTSVGRAIAHASERGVLVSAVRAKAGGPMEELEPHYWNTESFASRFFYCEMSLSSPFSSERRPPGGAWIFVTRVSIGDYLGAQRTESVAMRTINGTRECGLEEKK
jgi:hypothetical protein